MALRAPEADPILVKACCADLWAHPGIRLLVGDSLHPGGLDLTAQAAGRAGWKPGDLVLDLGCGPGATEEWLRGRGFRPVGVDYSAGLASEAAARAPRSWFAAADAEHLPFEEATFDGLLAECVLSVVPDVSSAADEAARVMRPGGRIAISDVTRSGGLPPELDTFLSWIACAAGALPPDGYGELLEGAGFEDVEVEDQSEALVAMVAKARRRLALLDGSVSAGVVDLGNGGLDPGLLETGRRLLELAGAAVAAGRLGYILAVGTRGGVG